jgi:hypothetical protein
VPAATAASVAPASPRLRRRVVVQTLTFSEGLLLAERGGIDAALAAR